MGNGIIYTPFMLITSWGKFCTLCRCVSKKLIIDLKVLNRALTGKFDRNIDKAF
jgi:hypothetical protein